MYERKLQHRRCCNGISSDDQNPLDFNNDDYVSGGAGERRGLCQGDCRKIIWERKCSGSDEELR